MPINSFGKPPMSRAQVAAIHEHDHAPGEGPLAGHGVLTMHDQMRAMGISSKPVTSPVTGAVVNRRREFMKGAIQKRHEEGAGHDPLAEHGPQTFGKGSGIGSSY